MWTKKENSTIEIQLLKHFKKVNIYTSLTLSTRSPRGFGFSWGVGCFSLCFTVRAQTVNSGKARTAGYSSLTLPKQCTAWLPAQS